MAHSDDPHEQWKNDPHFRLLKSEIAALDKRLDRESHFSKLVRSMWDNTPQPAAQSETRDDQHMAFYRNVLAQMLLGKFERIVPPDPLNDTDNLGASLARMNIVLDQKFAEIRAVTEIARDIGSGLFIEDVMDHIFKTFHVILPFDALVLSVVERDEDRKQMARTIWTRTRNEGLVRTRPRGYSQSLKDGWLNAVAEHGHPQIFADLRAHAHEHPETDVFKIALQDGILSMLTCPLVGKDGVFGFLVFASSSLNAYRDEHAQLFGTMAQSITHTLEKCYLYEDLTVRNQFIRTVFGRYISDEIASALLETPEALKMGGRTCCVTILMSDIRGFTKMSENMKPEEVVTILNTCFNTMVRVIHSHNGTIDNIIGDALMVLFGAPISRDDDELRAVRCAIDMQKAMAEVNEQNARLGLPSLSIGIGINTGDVVAGNIGSEAHAKYSVIGAPVNLAARLESQARSGEILISTQTMQKVIGQVDVLDEREIDAKGFSHPVKVYQISTTPKSRR